MFWGGAKTEKRQWKRRLHLRPRGSHYEKKACPTGKETEVKREQKGTDKKTELLAKKRPAKPSKGWRKH